MDLSALKILLFKWSKLVLDLNENLTNIDFIMIFTGLSEKLDLDQNIPMSTRIYNFVNEFVKFQDFPDDFISSDDESLFILLLLTITGTYHSKSCDLFRISAMKLNPEDQKLYLNLISNPLRKLSEEGYILSSDVYEIFNSMKTTDTSASSLPEEKKNSTSFIEEKVHEKNKKEIKKIRAFYDQQLIDLENIISHVKKENEELSKRLQAREASAKEDNLKIKDLLDENNSLLQNNTKFSDQKDHYLELLKHEQRKNAKLKEIETENEELRSKIQDLLDTSKTHDFLPNDSQKITKDLAEKSMAVEKLKEEINLLKDENFSYLKQISTLQFEINQLKSAKTINEKFDSLINLECSNLDLSNCGSQEVLADVIKKCYTDIQVQTDFTLSNLQTDCYAEPDQPPSISPVMSEDHKMLIEERDHLSNQVLILSKELHVAQMNLQIIGEQNDRLRSKCKKYENEVEMSMKKNNDLKRDIEKLQSYCEKMAEKINEDQHFRRLYLNLVKNQKQFEDHSLEESTESSNFDDDACYMNEPEHRNNNYHPEYCHEEFDRSSNSFIDFPRYHANNNNPPSIQYDPHWPDDGSSVNSDILRSRNSIVNIHKDPRVRDIACHHRTPSRSSISSLRSNLSQIKNYPEQKRPAFIDKTPQANIVKESDRTNCRSPTLTKEELEELSRRNRLYPKHLQSTYPIMTQRVPPNVVLESFTEQKNLPLPNSDSENIDRDIKEIERLTLNAQRRRSQYPLSTKMSKTGSVQLSTQSLNLGDNSSRYGKESSSSYDFVRNKKNEAFVINFADNNPSALPVKNKPKPIIITKPASNNLNASKISLNDRPPVNNANQRRLEFSIEIN